MKPDRCRPHAIHTAEFRHTGSKKRPSKPLDEFDDLGPTHAACERLPRAVLTDRYLLTVPGSNEALLLVAELLTA